METSSGSCSGADPSHHAPRGAPPTVHRSSCPALPRRRGGRQPWLSARVPHLFVTGGSPTVKHLLPLALLLAACASAPAPAPAPPKPVPVAMTPQPVASDI